jgi:transcriptional regulator with XRE-family HTH domain
MTITPAQVRLARELLHWTLLDVGFRAGVSNTTVRNFEIGRHIRDDGVRLIRNTFEAAGIRFDGKDGVRLQEKP